MALLGARGPLARQRARQVATTPPFEVAVAEVVANSALACSARNTFVNHGCKGIPQLEPNVGESFPDPDPAQDHNPSLNFVFARAADEYCSDIQALRPIRKGTHFGLQQVGPINCCACLCSSECWVPMQPLNVLHGCCATAWAHSVGRLEQLEAYSRKSSLAASFFTTQEN